MNTPISGSWHTYNAWHCAIMRQLSGSDIDQGCSSGRSKCLSASGSKCLSASDSECLSANDQSAWGPRSVILCPKQLANTSRCLWTEFCGDKYDISAYMDLLLASAGLRITAFIYIGENIWKWLVLDPTQRGALEWTEVKQTVKNRGDGPH